MISGVTMSCDLQPKQEDLEEEDDQEAIFLAAKRLKKSPEPTSVLYNRSPSPPTSSSLGGGAASSCSSAAAAPPEVPPISAEDWEAVLSGDMAAPAASHDQSFLRWLMAAGDGDASELGFGLEPASAFGSYGEGVKAPTFDTFLPRPTPPIQAALYQEQAMETAFLTQFPSPQQLQPQFAAPPLPIAAAGEPVVQASPKSNLEPPGLQQAVVDELLEASRLAEAGDLNGARGILARLNHRLPIPPLGQPPLLRSAAHLKDALLLLTATGAAPACVTGPLDVVLKLDAHKAFADASPITQFANFTSTQALLEALGNARRVHVIDFDVGFGGQWPPIMQELAHRWQRTPTSNMAVVPPMLRVTALVSPGSRHPIELHLTHENLSHFAAEVGIPFEFNAIVFDPFNQSPLIGLAVAADETVAVHLPIGSGTFQPVPAVLRIVKQLSPKIVVSVDHGCYRGDLPFSQHVFHVLQSCTALLESLDVASMTPDSLARIERFIVQPRIESLVLGHGRAGGEKLPPWRAMFASAGFVPLQLSNVVETQAECLLKRVPVRGFRVEKRQALLALWWQRAELVSVSAWRC